jgi:uncharacterized protein YigE (DUF2233 family)
MCFHFRPRRQWLTTKWSLVFLGYTSSCMATMRSLLIFGLLIGISARPISDATQWQSLAPGMDLKLVADSTITVVRIDPALWEFEFAGISRTGEASGHTAREWCERSKLAMAINAGMYHIDAKTHVGYFQIGEHVNSRQVAKYQSVAAFGPRNATLPRFRIFDLDAPGVTLQGIRKDYTSVAQNLRLIKRSGASQWGQQPKKWSEAALGEDSNGRVLFIFSRSPFSMHDLNQELLSAGIGVVAAQHLEGGPEAQLYIHAGKTEQEMFGSYETSFKENDANPAPWPIPNVIGVRPRSASAK